MFRQTIWGQFRIKTLLCLAQSLIGLSSLTSFLRKKWHYLVGETVGDSCSTGQRSEECTRSDGVERVRLSVEYCALSVYGV